MFAGGFEGPHAGVVQYVDIAFNALHGEVVGIGHVFDGVGLACCRSSGLGCDLPDAARNVVFRYSSSIGVISSFKSSFLLCGYSICINSLTEFVDSIDESSVSRAYICIVDCGCS